MTLSSTPVDGVVAISGTSTGVGKTVVTAAWAALARAEGRSVAVVKLAQTGAEQGDSDAAEVVRLAGLPADAVHVLASYPEPLAPSTAARRAGMPALRLGDAVEQVQQLARTHDLVLVEGAGGLLVQFDDATAWTLPDLATTVGAPVLVVAFAGLGTLNHSALTLEALRARRVEPLGVVIGSWPDEADLAARCNVAELSRTGALALLGALPEGLSATADPARFVAAARQGLAPRLGGTFDAADFAEKHAPGPYRPAQPHGPEAEAAE